jgi:SPP1 family predicted phage head-tail adaptor
MSAGMLRERLAFERRATGDDGYGNEGPFGDWERQFECHAGARPLRGSETVIAARLQGVQPYILTVRMSSNTRQVDASWRAVDLNDPKRIFNIKTAADPDGKNRWIEMLAETGGNF